MRQRAMIAIALACEPELLLADEPTTALDVTVQAQILWLLRDLQKRLDLAVIFVTHDLGVAAEIADDAAVMYAGRIVEQAPIRELFRRPAHPYTAGLMQATVRRGQKGRPLVPIAGAPPEPGRAAARLRVRAAVPGRARGVHDHRARRSTPWPPATPPAATSSPRRTRHETHVVILLLALAARQVLPLA